MASNVVNYSQNDTKINIDSKNHKQNTENIEFSPIDCSKCHQEPEKVEAKSSFNQLASNNSIICRICHQIEPHNDILNPCNCKGTLGYVHKRCLEHWLCYSHLTRCELCLYEFKTKQKLRYSLLQSLKVYYSHPNHYGLLQADALAFALITVLTNSDKFNLFQNDTKINIDSKNLKQNTENIEFSPNNCSKCHQEPEKIEAKSSFNQLASNNSIICRICHQIEPHNDILNPCNCKGTLGYVHKRCLEHWLCYSHLTRCELCLYEFKTKNKLRYSLLQSLKVYYSHPNHYGLLQADALAFALITVLTAMLICICYITLNYYTEFEEPYGFPKVWLEILVMAVLILVGIVYVLNLYATFYAQIMPWFRWWRSSRIIIVDLSRS
uniref:CSON013626 protein n=1 Tax=Culicoides sonorensis TaxID=179676 RepID=A0A336MKP5_CULSO